MLAGMIVPHKPSLNPCSNGICSLTKYQMDDETTFVGLNPCSNGICSLTWAEVHRKSWKMPSLNPCSNGICSLTEDRINTYLKSIEVLILVLMEYAL